MNAFEKLIDLLAGCLILFGLPLLYFGGQLRVIKTTLISQGVESFLQQVSTEGEVTEPVLMELLRTFDEFRCDSFEITRERTLYEPTSTGEVVPSLYYSEFDALTKELRRDNCVCLLKGDLLRVLVYCYGVPTEYSVSVRSGKAIP